MREYTTLQPKGNFRFGPDSAGPWRDRVFRDWLRTHDDDRDAYAATKREASAAAVAATLVGSVWIGYERRRVRRIEAQWISTHRGRPTAGVR